MLHGSSISQRWVRIFQRKNSADAKFSEERGVGDAPGAAADIPLLPILKTMVKQLSPVTHEIQGEVKIHLQPLEDLTLHGCKWMHSKEALTSWEASAGAGFWEHLWPFQ